jgi:PAS domain-containing protein
MASEDTVSTGSVDAIPAPVLVLGREGGRIRVTEDARELLGEALQQSPGLDPLAPLVEMGRSALDSGTETEDEIRIGDDDELVLDVTARPIAKQDATLFVLNDVTSYSERLEAQRKKKQVLQEAQEIASIGSWQWDLREDEVEWSDQLYEVFGRDPESFESTFEGYLECLHADDVAKVKDLIQQGRESGRAFTFEHRIVTPDDEVRRLHCRAEIVTGPEGEPVRMVGTAQAIDPPTM